MYGPVLINIMKVYNPMLLALEGVGVQSSRKSISHYVIQNNTIQYSFISAQHICSVHVMSVIVVDIYINAGLGDSY